MDEIGDVMAKVDSIIGRLSKNAFWSRQLNGHELCSFLLLQKCCLQYLPWRFPALSYSNVPVHVVYPYSIMADVEYKDFSHN